MKDINFLNANCDADFFCQNQVCQDGISCTRYIENTALDGLCKIQKNMTRAKFKCDEVAQTVNGGKIKLSPVTSGSEENKKFFNYTPYGQIEIGTINQEVIQKFIPGKEYYVDFTPAD